MFGYDALVSKSAQIIWDYMVLNHQLEACDLMLILGNRDPRTAQWGAKLYAQGFAGTIIVSGGVSLKNDTFDKKSWSSEADYFADILVKNGVPDKKIIRERTARNTGENITASYTLLHNMRLSPTSLLLVQKPYMERRTYATFMKQWPHSSSLERVIVSSPPIKLADYCNDKQDFDETISIMVGDLRRIELYPERNFQIAQHIPSNVREAADILSSYGFNKYEIQH